MNRCSGRDFGKNGASATVLSDDNGDGHVRDELALWSALLTIENWDAAEEAGKASNVAAAIEASPGASLASQDDSLASRPVGLHGIASVVNDWPAASSNWVCLFVAWLCAAR